MADPISQRLAQLRVRHLGLLDVIAQSGSLRQASVELCVTQPAVTAMLQAMETSFGVSLVERDSNGARLTNNGRQIQERLRLILNNLSAVYAELGEPVVHRQLRVGVLESMMIEVVPEAVALLRRTHPDITFTFAEDTVSALAQGVLDGSYDCAVGRFDAAIDVAQLPALDASLIGDVPLQIACGRSNPLHKARKLSLADLKDKDWIIAPKGSRGRESFEQAFLLAGLPPPRPRIESISFHSNFQLAARTDMLTMSTAAAVAHYSKLGIIRRLDIEWPVKLPPMMFFCRKEAAGLEAIRLFRDALAAG